MPKYSFRAYDGLSTGVATSFTPLEGCLHLANGSLIDAAPMPPKFDDLAAVGVTMPCVE